MFKTQIFSLTREKHCFRASLENCYVHSATKCKMAKQHWDLSNFRDTPILVFVQDPSGPYRNQKKYARIGQHIFIHQNVPNILLKPVLNIYWAQKIA